MKFKATPALMQLLSSQLECYPAEYSKEGEESFKGGSVYAKLDALDKGGIVEITEPERRELESLLDSIVGPGGWDEVYPGERRAGKAALRQLRG